MALYRVRVENPVDAWEKGFSDPQDALRFYRRCGNAQETLQNACTVTLDELGDMAWETVYRREVVRGLG